MLPPPVISYLCIQGTINISHAILYPLLVQNVQKYMYFIKIMSNKFSNLLAYVCSHCNNIHFSTLSRSYNFLHKASNLVCHNIYSFRIFVCTPA